MANNYDWITEEGLKFVPEDLQKNAKENKWEDLQNAAIRFLHNAEILVETLQNEEKFKKSVLHGTNFLNISKIYNTMYDAHDKANNQKNATKKQQIVRKLINQQYLFQHALNRFLDRTISLAWVSEDGKIIITSELQERLIYNHLAGRQSGRGSIHIGKKLANKLETLMKGEDSLSKKLLEIIKNREEIYKKLFLEVKIRWEMNHKQPKTWTKHWWLHYRDTLWWRISSFRGKQWGHSDKIQNLGYISEAYVNLVMGNTGTFKMQNDIEANVANYWRYMQQAGVFNAIPGIVKGDVQLGIKASQDGAISFPTDSIQFSVKTRQDFSTAKIGPYLQVAYMLIDFNHKELTKQEVLQLLNQVTGKFDYSTKIEQEARNKIEDTISDSIKKAGFNLIE